MGRARAVAVLLAAVTGLASAGIPVVEIGPNVAHNAQTATHTALSNQHERVMMELLEQIRIRIEGVSGWGLHENSGADGERRRFLPSDFQAAIRAYLSGSGGRADYTKAVGQRHGLYPIYSRQEYVPIEGHENKRLAASRQEYALSVGVLESAAEATFVQQLAAIGRAESLLKAIETSQHQKKIADLQTRLDGERAFIALLGDTLGTIRHRAEAARMRTEVEQNKQVGDALGTEKSHSAPAIGSGSGSGGSTVPCSKPPCPTTQPGPTRTTRVTSPSKEPYAVRAGRLAQQRSLLR